MNLYSTPEISIIVPIYNAEKYLTRCLNSILNQTFKCFELLLINDGSSDDSLNICKRFALKDKRIIVYDKQNEGVSATRQFGIEKAKGTYSIFIDADDWIDSNMLSDMHQLMIQHQYDILICNYFMNNDLVKEKQGIKAPKEIIHNMLNSKIKGVMWNKLVKHSLYTQYKIKFPAKINFCEDVFVCMQLFLFASHIGYTEKAYYHYMENPTSITRKLNKNILLQRIEFVHLASTFLSKNDMDKNWLLWHKLDLKWIGFASGLFTLKEYRNIFPELFQEYNILTYPKSLKNIMILYLASYATFWFLLKRVYLLKK